LLEEMQLPERSREVYLLLLEFNPMHAQARERLAALPGPPAVEKHSSRVPHFFGRKS
jgi:hypothetical protein